MRPYLSIIKDSFRAAMASRVLYVALVCITLLLAILVPISVTEQLAWRIAEDRDVRNPDGLAKRLGGDGPNENDRRVHHIFQQLPQELRDKLVLFYEADQQNRNRTRTEPENPFSETGTISRQSMWQEILRELNELIRDQDLYDAEVYGSAILVPEAEDLIESGVDQLTTEQRRRLNRLLVEYSIGNSFIRPSAPSSLQVAYAVWELPGFNYNMTKPELNRQISQTIPYVLDKFVLSITLLVAVLLTASLIPEMLQASSLNLLLSKPITRWGLLVSKFIGGCAFIAILVSYLYLGIWLLLGMRVGYWDRAILISIPVYIFVFAIYFSFSTLIGVLFRNTIVSILLTALFWLACFGVGVVYYRFSYRMQASEITELVPAGDALFSLDAVGMPYRYDPEDATWEVALLENDVAMQNSMAMYIGAFFAPPHKLNFPQPVGPIYDPQTETVQAGIINFGAVETMDSKTFVASSAARDWKPVNAGSLPRNTIKLIADNELGVCAVTGTGLFYRLTDNPIQNTAGTNTDPTDGQPPANANGTNETNETNETNGTNVNDAAPSDGPGSEQGAGETNQAPTADESNYPDQPGAAEQPTQEPNSASRPQMDVTTSQPTRELFERMPTDRRIDITDADYVDFNPSSNELAVYWRGQVSIFEFEEGKFRFASEITPDFNIDPSMTTWIRYRGDMIFLAFGNGELLTVDRDSGELLNQYLPESQYAIRSVSGSPKGRWFAACYRNGQVWILDTQNPQQMKRADVRGQGDISMAKFDDQGQLWIADRTDRLTVYATENWEQLREITPRGYFLANTFRYGIRPLYRAFPKPGEFYNLVAYLSGTSDRSYDRSIDLTQSESPETPWAPFRSGLVFILVTLVISSWIFSRQEY